MEAQKRRGTKVCSSLGRTSNAAGEKEGGEEEMPDGPTSSPAVEESLPLSLGSALLASNVNDFWDGHDGLLTEVLTYLHVPDLVKMKQVSGQWKTASTQATSLDPAIATSFRKKFERFYSR